MSEFLTGLHVGYHVALNIPAVRAGAAGAAAAGVIDFAAFRQFKSWHDLAVYDWGTASFRWVMGFASGALASLGLGVL
jgi:hypothetical protein